MRLQFVRSDTFFSLRQTKGKIEETLKNMCWLLVQMKKIYTKKYVYFQFIPCLRRKISRHSELGRALIKFFHLKELFNQFSQV